MVWSTVTAVGGSDRVRGGPARDVNFRGVRGPHDDDVDRVETRTDPLSRDESFAYDLLGNLVTTYQYDETALSRAKRERSESRSASEWGWSPTSAEREPADVRRLWDDLRADLRQ